MLFSKMRIIEISIKFSNYWNFIENNENNNLCIFYVFMYLLIYFSNHIHHVNSKCCDRHVYPCPMSTHYRCKWHQQQPKLVPTDYTRSPSEPQQFCHLQYRLLLSFTVDGWQCPWFALPSYDCWECRYILSTVIDYAEPWRISPHN